jgi:hypothetical protein
MILGYIIQFSKDFFFFLINFNFSSLSPESPLSSRNHLSLSVSPFTPPPPCFLCPFHMHQNPPSQTPPVTAEAPTQLTKTHKTPIFQTEREEVPDDGDEGPQVRMILGVRPTAQKIQHKLGCSLSLMDPSTRPYERHKERQSREPDSSFLAGVRS